MRNTYTSNIPLQKVKGFTLIELVVVIAIVGILAAIAFPAYQDTIRKTRRADAQGALMGLANAMERHYTSNGAYTGAAAGGANNGAPAIYPTQVPIDGGNAFYNLTIAATATSYTLTATALGAQAVDGNLTLTNTGVRTWNGNPGWE